MNTLCVDYDIYLKSIAWIGYDEKNYFTSTSLQQFHLQLPSIPFLDIKISIKGNGLCTSVYFKPTDSHSYLSYLSSHSYHVKNSIPFSRFLRLRCLCSDDSVFSEKSEAMCQIFEKRGYPVSEFHTFFTVSQTSLFM